MQLALNLAAGVGTTVPMLGGLMALNPQHLRELIFADQLPGAAWVLFGLIIIFGSATMGSAIMALGCTQKCHASGGKTQAEFAAARGPR
jgi:hypothetical protein